MGTPLYMSPEQARGETLTPASDMYAFGLLLQTLFTGQGNRLRSEGDERYAAGSAAAS